MDLAIKTVMKSGWSRKVEKFKLEIKDNISGFILFQVLLVWRELAGY